jgi:vanillate O-demethylase ferredoxin subunit
MNPITVHVTKKTVEALDIVSLELRAPDGGPLPAFAAGAHIDVHLGPGLVRPYSLCNSPAEDRRYVIAVLREPKSRGGSVAVHDAVQSGDRLQISAPKNNFALVPQAPALLLAGGIGITPILAMAHQLMADATPFALHYCARSRERAAFVPQMQASLPPGTLHCHFDDGPADQRLDLAQVLRQVRPDTHVYICGPGGFIDHALATARESRWPEAQVHRELFSVDPQRVAPTAGDTPFDLRIASTGQLIRVAAAESAAAALARAGVQVPVACEQGICGTCVTRVLEGTPDHRDMYFTAQEHARNDQFTPCCSRARSPLLVLDL